MAGTPTPNFGLPQYDDSDTSALDVLLNGAFSTLDTSLLVALLSRGAYRVGSDADRMALTGGGLFEGLRFWVTATRIEWLYTNGAWVVQDTGWVNLSLASGYSAQSGRTPQVRRIGKALYSRGLLTRTPDFGTSVVYNDVATVPPSFATGYQYDRQLSGHSAHVSVRGYLSASGGVTIITGPVAPSYVDLSGLSGQPVD